MNAVPDQASLHARGHVFVSHARADTEYATRLAAQLASVDVPVWIDDDLSTGDRWVSVICSRLDECVALVVVMSPAAAESVWVEREIRYVETLGKPILPVLLAGRPFFRLVDLQYEDVTKGQPPSPKFVAKIGALVGANTGEDDHAGGNRASATQVWQVRGTDWTRALRVFSHRRAR